LCEQERPEQTTKPEKRKRYVDPLEIVASVVLGWVILLGATLLYEIMAYDELPKTGGEWVLFIIVAPPVYAGLNILGEGLFYSPKAGDKLYGKPYSLRRIIVRLICLVGMLAAFFIGYVVWNRGM